MPLSWPPPDLHVCSSLGYNAFSPDLAGVCAFPYFRKVFALMLLSQRVHPWPWFTNNTSNLPSFLVHSISTPCLFFFVAWLGAFHWHTLQADVLTDGFVCAGKGEGRLQGWLLYLGPEQLENGDTIYWDEATWGRSLFWEERVGEDQDFHFWHVINISIRYQGGEVWWACGYTCLESTGAIGSEDKNSWVMNTYRYLKTWSCLISARI